MRDFIADKAELYLTTNHFRKVTHSADPLMPPTTTNNEENKKAFLQKGATLRLDGPIAGLCSLWKKGAAYIRLTKICTARSHSSRSKCRDTRRAQNRKMKTQTEYGGLTPKSGQSWLMSLPEHEPPEWHNNWKSYWTYDRQKRKFSS